VLYSLSIEIDVVLRDECQSLYSHREHHCIQVYDMIVPLLLQVTKGLRDIGIFIQNLPDLAKPFPVKKVNEYLWT
jgi:hypothetical protein